MNSANEHNGEINWLHHKIAEIEIVHLCIECVSVCPLSVPSVRAANHNFHVFISV